MDMKNKHQMILGALIAFTIICFTYAQAPIALPSKLIDCGTETNTETVLLVVGDSVCAARYNLEKNCFSPFEIQLNPFWNICNEKNVTVHTECHNGKGLAYLGPQMDSYLIEYKPDAIIIQSFWNDMAPNGVMGTTNKQAIPCEEYLNHLTNIIDKTKKTNTTFSLIFGTLEPAGDKAGNYSLCIREYAITNNITFLDLKELNSNGTASLDAVHPNQKGHDLIKAYVRGLEWI